MSRVHFDADAALWFAVALLASAFATLPVLAIGLAVLHHPIDGWRYIAATGAVTAVAFGVTAAMLVRARPWRTFLDTIVTLYLLQFGASLLLVAGQFIRAPEAVGIVGVQLLASLTFGFVQVDSFSPLRLAFPDSWPLVGVIIGMLLARWVLVARGRPVGPDARVIIEPMRLPEPDRGPVRTPPR